MFILSSSVFRNRREISFRFTWLCLKKLIFSMFLVSGEKRSVPSGAKNRVPSEIGLGAFFTVSWTLVPLYQKIELLQFTSM